MEEDVVNICGRSTLNWIVIGGIFCAVFGEAEQQKPREPGLFTQHHCQIGLSAHFGPCGANFTFIKPTIETPAHT